jgi:hypothetical protein
MSAPTLMVDDSRSIARGRLERNPKRSKVSQGVDQRGGPPGNILVRVVRHKKKRTQVATDKRA